MSMSAFPADYQLPTIVRGTVLRDDPGIRVKRGENDTVLIVSVDKNSMAAKSGLEAGFEIVAVNGQQVLGNAVECWRLLTTSSENGGKASVLASTGVRPRGYSYVLLEKFNNDIIRSSGDGNVIDGLALQESNGKVKIRRTPEFSSSHFHGLCLNEGDVVCTITGIPINSIQWAKVALKVASGPLVPILTYNIWRRVKLILLRHVRSKKIANIWIGNDCGGAARKIGDDYDIHETMRVEGSFAIRRATLKKTGKSYAIKTFHRPALTIAMDSAARNEMKFLTSLQHPNIIGLYDTIVTPTEYHLIGEQQIEVELFEQLARKENFTEADARDVCKAALSALKYMHSEKGVVHRNLSPECIWLQRKDDYSSVKIGAFEFAKVAEDDHSLHTMCGSQGYVAPEVLRGSSYGSKSDMWSIAVTVFLMMMGRLPFIANTELELHRIAKAGRFSFEGTQMSHSAKEMIRSLLVTDPGRRASANQVLSQPWMIADREGLGISLLQAQKQLKRLIAQDRLLEAIHKVEVSLDVTRRFRSSVVGVGA